MMEIIKKHLSKDKIMKSAIEKYGLPEKIESDHSNLYSQLVESIIGQQLSGKAADTIASRVRKLTKTKKNFTPEKFTNLSIEQLRETGVSRSKASYIKEVSSAFGTVEFSSLDLAKLDDVDFVKKLTQIKGVGNWTAEMILIFTLGREDIFSHGDNGLLSSLEKHYQIDRKDKNKIIEITDKWRPYRSYGSRLLWKMLDNR